MATIQVPSLIRCLPIFEHLKIHNKSDSALLCGLDITSIPSTIRTLDLWYRNDMDNFLVASSSPNGSVDAKLINLSLLFPNLERFSCLTPTKGNWKGVLIVPEPLPPHLVNWNCGSPIPLNLEEFCRLSDSLTGWSCILTVLERPEYPASAFGNAAVERKCMGWKSDELSRSRFASFLDATLGSSTWLP